MKLFLKKRAEGCRFGTSWVLEDETGHVVQRSGIEPFGFATGARTLTIWARDNGHWIVGGGVLGEPRWV